MAGRARDVQELLPDGAILYADDATFMSFSVPRNGELTSDCLQGLYDQLFTSRIDINFDTCMVDVFHSTQVQSVLPDTDSVTTSVILKADTESERSAATLAKALGCIDYDNLQPRFNIETVAGTTSLLISRLNRVSNSALAEQLPCNCNQVVYRFSSKDIAVRFAAHRKRKAA